MSRVERFWCRRLKPVLNVWILPSILYERLGFFGACFGVSKRMFGIWSVAWPLSAARSLFVLVFFRGIIRLARIWRRFLKDSFGRLCIWQGLEFKIFRRVFLKVIVVRVTRDSFGFFFLGLNILSSSSYSSLLLLFPILTLLLQPSILVVYMSVWLFVCLRVFSGWSRSGFSIPSSFSGNSIHERTITPLLYHPRTDPATDDELQI